MERESVSLMGGYIFLRLKMAVSRKAMMSSHLTHNPI